VRRGGGGAALAEVAVVSDRRVPLAVAAQGEGLVLDHCHTFFCMYSWWA
jgi:hypothetical protein